MFGESCEHLVFIPYKQVLHVLLFRYIKQIAHVEPLAFSNGLQCTWIILATKRLLVRVLNYCLHYASLVWRCVAECSPVEDFHPGLEF